MHDVDDILTEDPVTLTEATRIFPGRPHASSIWRWYKHGCAGVKLETYCAGGRRFTTRESITRFIQRVTAARDGVATEATPSRRRQREIEKAERELDEVGI